MKKHNPALSMFLIAGILVAFGCVITRTPGSLSDFYEKIPSKTGKKTSSNKNTKPYKATTPGYDMPELANKGANAILSASFIYWKPKQDEFSIGITGPRPTTAQKVYDFESSYQPGFKAGIGVTSSYDQWSVFAEYTRLRTHDTTSKYTSAHYPMIMSPWVAMTVQDQSLYDPTTSSTTGEILTSSVSNSWHINFQMIDFSLSRSYYVGKKLVFNPFLTARGARINQHLSVNFLYKVRETPHVTSTIYSYNKNHTKQIGPRLGLDMSWLIGNSFRFGGTLAGGILYTEYQLLHKETLNNVVHANVQYNPHAFRFNCDAALQFGWRIFAPSHRRYCDVFFKYEAIAFWQQNMVSGLTTTINDQGKKLQDGNLYFQGGTFNLAFNF